MSKKCTKQIFYINVVIWCHKDKHEINILHHLLHYTFLLLRKTTLYYTLLHSITFYIINVIGFEVKRNFDCVTDGLKDEELVLNDKLEDCLHWMIRFKNIWNKKKQEILIGKVWMILWKIRANAHTDINVK